MITCSRWTSRTWTGCPPGQLVSRANSDSTLVQAFLSYLPTMGGNVLLMLFSLAIMLYLCPLLAVGQSGHRAADAVVRYRMRRKLFPATWDGQQREGDVAQIVDEDINGVRVVKAFGQERRELQTPDRGRRDPLRLTDAHRPAASPVQPIATGHPERRPGRDPSRSAAGWLHHDISLGTFLAFSTYFVQMVSPARQMAGVLTVAQLAAPAWNGISRSSTDSQQSPTPPTPSRCPSCVVTSGSTMSPSTMKPDSPLIEGLNLPHPRRGAGGPWSGPAAAASQPSPC